VAEQAAVQDYKILTRAELKNTTLTDYQRIMITKAQMDLEFNYYKTFAKELSQNIDPHRWYEPYNNTDLEPQQAAQVAILSGAPAAALDAEVAGLGVGVAPATSEWFLFGLKDRKLEDNFEVLQWLRDEKEDQERVIQKSNFFSEFPLFLRDFIVNIGGCMFVEADETDVFRVTTFRPGQFRISLDSKGYPVAFNRTFRYTVRQVLEKWGKYVNKTADNPEGDLDCSNLSARVVIALKAGQMDQWLDINHYIGLNREADPNMLSAKYKKWTSKYMEMGLPPSSGGSMPEQFLEETGYDYFPVIYAAWETNGKDAYASNGPGKRALPDIKELYFLEQGYMTALELKYNPPLGIHPDIENVDTLPGGKTQIPNEEAMKVGIQSLYKVDLDLNHLRERINEIKQEVREHFQADFFRMLLDDDRKQPMTATEVLERKKEVMVLLGPAFGRITKFCLEPLINIVYQLRLKYKRVKPAPAIMQNQLLEVRFVSVIAKALKMGDFSILQAASQYLTAMAKEFPNSKHTVDDYEMAVAGMEALGVPPKLLKTKEDYQAAVDAEAKALAQERQAKTLPAVAGAAQELSNTDPSGGMLGKLRAMNSNGSGISAA